MNIPATLALLLQAAVADSATTVAARNPSYARDGRLILSIEGDLFLQTSPGQPLRQVTRGIAWDRDAVFTPDGSAIVYSSDASGSNYDLYRVTLSRDGVAGTPERLTTSPLPDLSPSVAASGAILFARGNGASSRIYIRETNGTERRLLAGDAAESSPSIAPDGVHYAYLSLTEAGRRLIVRSLASKDSSVANTDANAERIAWAPGSDRIAISSRAGVQVVPLDGRYANLVSSKRGDLAWAPDGKTIAIAEYDDVNVGYNGDPDRRLDRSAGERFRVSERLYFVAAPPPPDMGLAEQKLVATRDRAARNADTFDRVWERSARLYFSSNDAAAQRAIWEKVKATLRPRAIAASNDDELQQVIYDALRQRPSLRNAATGRAAVSSAHPVATAAGLEMLSAGGNVVDAAVAVSFALGVVEPDASGVGGYGEMVIALKSAGKPTLIEFMSRVPENAPLSNTSLLRNGRYPGDGPVLTNIPGTVAGMYEAWKKYGSKKVPWARLLEPAIRAARNGYVVSEGLATTLATEREHFLKYEGSRALFFRNGEPLAAGDTLRNPDLAWVLEQIARDGANGFYRGEVARKYVNDLHAKGNAMKMSDMERYFAPEREPVSGTYRDYTLYSSAPPVSGGAELVARLNLLEQFPSPKLYTEDATTLHAALSAWFLVPSTRNRIADPSLWATDIEPIVNRDTARARWKCFNADKALRPADVRGDNLPCLRPAGAPAAGTAPARRDSSETDGDASVALFTENGASFADNDTSPCGADHAREMHTCHAAGTTAFTVADNEGNAVAVTQTLGTWGGNFYVTPGLGFLSNDKLTSYGTDSTQYGSRLPFARHGSTLAPTIVMKGGTPVFAIGAAGNAWITSAVYQGLIGALDFNLGPQQALELPRFLPGGGGGGGGGGAAQTQGAARTSPPYTIQLEDGFSPAVIRRLRELGYDLNFVSMRGELREGYGAAVRISGKQVTAGADPRRAGAAGAIR